MMFNKLKTKMAARRVKTSKARAKTKNNQKKRNGFWRRVWNIVCWPFHMIAKLCKKIWKWLGSINIIAMVNLALLVTIIVLFSMLIIDVISCRKQVVVVANKPQPEQVIVTEANAPRNIKPRPVLPIKAATNAQKNKNAAPTVSVVPVKQSESRIAQHQLAKHNNEFWGDIIIDNRGAGAMLQAGTKVNGNLYVQNMRKYTLPCDIRINGNLFLRDVNMLQFCGDFIITGNIYVSPRSSFGPIPKTARLGGHVVL